MSPEGQLQDMPGNQAVGGCLREKPETFEISRLEVFIYPGRVDVFERQGNGMTALLVEILEGLGLKTFVRTSSPCG